MQVKTIRQVKLYSKYRYANRGWLNDETKIVPWLNVSGVWLEQAGFNAGDQVEITITNNTLTIKKLLADGNP
jgi:toxic protein SymE